MPQNAGLDYQVVINARTFDQDGEVTAIPSRRVTELMLELLDLKPTDKLMEIGTGSEFQTQAWAATGAEVHTLELKPVRSADYLGDSVYYHYGDGACGLPQEAPFSAIVATCGVSDIPAAWKDQLRDGGRLVIPFGSPQCQKLTLFMKKNGILGACRIAGYVRFQMMREI